MIKYRFDWKKMIESDYVAELIKIYEAIDNKRR